jgi:hypothetical protein
MTLKELTRFLNGIVKARLNMMATRQETIDNTATIITA